MESNSLRCSFLQSLKGRTSGKRRRSMLQNVWSMESDIFEKSILVGKIRNKEYLNVRIYDRNDDNSRHLTGFSPLAFSWLVFLFFFFIS